MNGNKKRVRFQMSPPTVYIEPDEIAVFLYQMRINTFQRDLHRMKQLLTPILDPVHRSNVWKRNTSFTM